MNRNHLILTVLLASMLAMTGRAAVTFPRGQTVFVVASPQTDLERRVLDRLTNYASRVSGKPVKVVSSLQQKGVGAWDCHITPNEISVLKSGYPTPSFPYESNVWPLAPAAHSFLTSLAEDRCLRMFRSPGEPFDLTTVDPNKRRM